MFVCNVYLLNRRHEELSLTVVSWILQGFLMIKEKPLEIIEPADFLRVLNN